MKFTKTKLSDLYLIEPELFKDKRGVFRRNFCQKEIRKKILINGYEIHIFARNVFF